MSTTSYVKRVVVCGGGIGGLALAIALRQRGLDPVVAERAPRYTEAGAGLVLTPNGMKALAALGPEVAADVRDSGAPFLPDDESRFLTRRAKTLGRPLMGGSEATWGASTVPTLRTRVRDVLLTHAHKHGVPVRTGAAVTGYTDSGSAVSVQLADGAELTADLLVGADGVRSTVRRQLLADGEPRYTGYTAVLGTGPAPDPYPCGFLAYGRGLILFSAPIGERRLYWAATIRTPQGTWPAKVPAAARSELLDRLDREGWHRDLSHMIEGAAPDTMVLTDVCDRDPVQTWSRGRVVLLGDAAHPMAPTMGQGANMALEDAVVLAHHLTDGAPLDETLARFTERRAPRTAGMVRQARMIGVIGHARNPVAAWGRDRMMSLMERFGDFDKQNADLMGWNPPAH